MLRTVKSYSTDMLSPCSMSGWSMDLYQLDPWCLNIWNCVMDRRACVRSLNEKKKMMMIPWEE